MNNNYSSSRSQQLRTALSYVDAGLSVIPIGQNKQPAISSWHPYQQARATATVLQSWFNTPKPEQRGLAVICGKVSGNLEVLDFDDPAALAPWRDLLEEHTPGLYERLPLIQTPSGGFQIPYRCTVIEGNQKLARRKVIIEDSDVVNLQATVGAAGHQKQVLKIFLPQSGKTKTAQRETINGRQVWTYIEEVIETRGEGGYVVTCPSPAHCHPTGRLYSFIAGDWCDLPQLTEDERLVMMAMAISLDEMPEVDHQQEQPPAKLKAVSKTPGLSVGDDFNARASWSEILEPHGWRFIRNRGGVGFWKRPGDSKAPHSALTNSKGTDTLAVFTTATVFEDVMSKGTTYSKFGAYACLNYNGDFTETVHDLAMQGYGSKEWKPRQAIGAGVVVVGGDREKQTFIDDNIVALANLDYTVMVAFACWNISDASYRTFQAVKQLFNGRKVWGLSGAYVARHIKATASLEGAEPSESDKSFGNRRLKNLIKELTEKVNYRIFTVHEKGDWKLKKAARYRLDLSVFEKLMEAPEDLSLTFEKSVYQNAAQLRIQTLKVKNEKDAITRIFDYRESLIQKGSKLADCLAQVHGENYAEMATEANQILGAVAEQVFKGIPPAEREFFELETNIIKISSWNDLKRHSRKVEKSDLVASNQPDFSLESSPNTYQTQQDAESLVAQNELNFSLDSPEESNDGNVHIVDLNYYTDKSVNPFLYCGGCGGYGGGQVVVSCACGWKANHKKVAG